MGGGYLKEVFDMYGYLMYVMNAVEEDKAEEEKRNKGTMSREQILKDKKNAFQKLVGDSYVQSEADKKYIVTIEVTPEDMKAAKKDKARRQKELTERRLALKEKRDRARNKNRNNN